MEKGQSKVEKARREWLAVDQQVLFGKVPAPRTHQQGRGVRGDFIGFAQFVLELQVLTNRFAQVDLAADDIAPSGRQRIFEVAHEGLGAAV